MAGSRNLQREIDSSHISLHKNAILMTKYVIANKHAKVVHGLLTIKFNLTNSIRRVSTLFDSSSTRISAQDLYYLTDSRNFQFSRHDANCTKACLTTGCTQPLLLQIIRLTHHRPGDITATYAEPRPNPQSPEKHSEL